MSGTITVIVVAGREFGRCLRGRLFGFERISVRGWGAKGVLNRCGGLNLA